MNRKELPQLIKNSYKKNPTADIILNVEKLIPSFQHCIGSACKAIREEKEIKGIKIRKKGIKLSSFTYDMNCYVENLKESTTTKKLPELINYYSKVAEYEVNVQKSIDFLYTRNKLAKFES